MLRSKENCTDITKLKRQKIYFNCSNFRIKFTNNYRVFLSVPVNVVQYLLPHTYVGQHESPPWWTGMQLVWCGGGGEHFTKMQCTMLLTQRQLSWQWEAGVIAELFAYVWPLIRQLPVNISSTHNTMPWKPIQIHKCRKSELDNIWKLHT